MNNRLRKAAVAAAVGLTIAAAAVLPAQAANSPTDCLTGRVDGVFWQAHGYKGGERVYNGPLRVWRSTALHDCTVWRNGL